MGKKRRYEVQDNESIAQCLERMDNEGYKPVKRIEEPIFHEVNVSGKIDIQVLKQKIIFEGTPKSE